MLVLTKYTSVWTFNYLERADLKFMVSGQSKQHTHVRAASVGLTQAHPNNDIIKVAM